MISSNNVNRVNVEKSQYGMNARTAESVETALFKFTISTKQSIDRYDTSGEDFISGRVVHTTFVAHTTRMKRVERLLLAAIVKWSVEMIWTVMIV